MAGSESAYQLLAASLRDALRRGEYANGRRLPTEAELAVSAKVSRQTVRRALQDLVAEGLVYRVRGRGTFATPVSANTRFLRSFGSVDDLMAYSLDTTMETLEPLHPHTDIEAAARLRLPSDDVMSGLVRRLRDRSPFSVTRVFLPPSIGALVRARGMMVQEGATDGRTIIGVIDEVAPPGVAGVQQSITATTASPPIAPLVECAAGEPVLRVDRLYLDQSGTPLELAISHINPERYTYRFELSRQLRS